MVRSHGVLLYEHICICICFHKNFISTDVGSGPLRAERRRRKARREIFTTPRLVTARQSILGPPAEGRPGPSINKYSNIMAFARQAMSKRKSPTAITMISVE